MRSLIGIAITDAIRPFIWSSSQRSCSSRPCRRDLSVHDVALAMRSTSAKRMSRNVRNATSARVNAKVLIWRNVLVLAVEPSGNFPSISAIGGSQSVEFDPRTPAGEIAAAGRPVADTRAAGFVGGWGGGECGAPYQARPTDTLLHSSGPPHGRSLSPQTQITLNDRVRPFCGHSVASVA
ncbi:hypothetical protein BQ8482_150112 [Mesorhizobium delmotii]|uniref:Uncharacterized protein n=1 Tax=Mesorhizobium delmotii TaxID=1631247 RepID=A0A2P9AHC4_9HYPH|nr:hypothetical protein BQ8482_150112 [Mesorhizobium delmotii]